MRKTYKKNKGGGGFFSKTTVVNEKRVPVSVTENPIHLKKIQDNKEVLVYFALIMFLGLLCYTLVLLFKFLRYRKIKFSFV